MKDRKTHTRESQRESECVCACERYKERGGEREGGRGREREEMRENVLCTIALTARQPQPLILRQHHPHPHALFLARSPLSIFSSPLPHNPAYAAAVPGHRIRGAAERGAGPCDPCPPAACPPACHPAHLHVTLCGRAGLGRPPVCDAHGAAAGVRCPPLVRALGARTHTHSCTHTHTHTHTHTQNICTQARTHAWRCCWGVPSHHGEASE